MGTHFENIVEAVTADPAIKIGEIDMLKTAGQSPLKGQSGEAGEHSPPQNDNPESIEADFDF
ncbi:MAG: hypothetical protein GY757_32065 [bacterium]|nr:hypothetical protein [bacterium]